MRGCDNLFASLLKVCAFIGRPSRGKAQLTGRSRRRSALCSSHLSQASLALCDPLRGHRELYPAASSGALDWVGGYSPLLGSSRRCVASKAQGSQTGTARIASRGGIAMATDRTRGHRARQVVSAAADGLAARGRHPPGRDDSPSGCHAGVRGPPAGLTRSPDSCDHPSPIRAATRRTEAPASLAPRALPGPGLQPLTTTDPGGGQGSKSWREPSGPQLPRATRQLCFELERWLPAAIEQWPGQFGHWSLAAAGTRMARARGCQQVTVCLTE